MTNVLLISICIMVLITMVMSIISTVIITKYTKSEKIVTKVLKIVGIVFAVILVIGCATGISFIKKNDNASSGETISLENAGFNNVSLQEYQELIKEDKNNIILIARPTCSYCELFTPILKEASEDLGLTVNYIDTDTFTNDDWTTFNSSLDYLSQNEWGTPLVLITKNGKVVADNSGYVELDVIKSFFKENGLGE